MNSYCLEYEQRIQTPTSGLDFVVIAKLRLLLRANSMESAILNGEEALKFLTSQPKNFAEPHLRFELISTEKSNA